MKLRNITKLIGIGAAAIIMTGCGSSSSTENSTTPPPVQPAPDPTEPPLSTRGNEILLPGYTYPAREDDIYEMYVAEAGNILFAGGRCAFYAFDANFNDYKLNEYDNRSDLGRTEYFEAGMYYINAKSRFTATCNITVESNVLYNPLAQ